jgi:hypothetical protein
MGEWMYRSTYFWPRHWMEESDQLHDPTTLPPGKMPLDPLDRRMGGPENWSGRHGGEKNLPPPELELRPACSQPLCRLRYPAPKCHSNARFIRFPSSSLIANLPFWQDSGGLPQFLLKISTKEFKSGHDPLLPSHMWLTIHTSLPTQKPSVEERS